MIDSFPASACGTLVLFEKYWEIIADNLSKAGWSWGCVSALDPAGRTIWIADAHRDDGKRFVVRADEKLTAFVELEAACAGGKSASQAVAGQGGKCGSTLAHHLRRWHQIKALVV
jgi:hypothetical protein